MLIIIIIIILFLLTYKKNKYSKYYISRNSFNNRFNSKLIIPPGCITACGFDNGNIYIYNQFGILSEELNKEHINIMLDYWIKYINPNILKKKYYFLLCSFDGYRERIPYNNLQKKYIKNKYKFLFAREIIKSDTIMPIIHKNEYVLCFAKHINDSTAITIPDLFYMTQLGYHNTRLKTIDDNFIPFDNKENKCIYRGSKDLGTVFNFFNYKNKKQNQRMYFISLYNNNKINNMNYSDTFTSIPDQLKYKYILDIDGFSNTWDGTVWKLYSGSVLLKVKGVWKQWYYDNMKEWIHYVPVNNDFSDINEKIEWCINNDDKCKLISENARQFVKEYLNFNTVNKNLCQQMNELL
jgi:hypothetical protein